MFLKQLITLTGKIIEKGIAKDHRKNTSKIKSNNRIKIKIKVNTGQVVEVIVVKDHIVMRRKEIVL